MFVDVERAVLATPEGKRAAVELEAERGRVDEELHKKEVEIAAVRKKLEKDPSARTEYQLKAADYETLVQERQDAMEKAQDRRFEPIIAEIDARMAKTSAPPIIVVDAAEHPPLFPEAACDITQQIIAQTAIKKNAACEKKAVFYIDLDRVMRALEESKGATARLDSFQRQRQSELDQRARAIEARGGPELELNKLELADRYAAYRKELEAREAKELSAMRKLAIAKITARRDDYPGVVFVEKIAEVEMVAGGCDVTRFFSGDDPAGLTSACPAWGGAK